MTSSRFGIGCILLATAMWGFSPLYYALMDHIPPLEIVTHRLIWSLPPLALYALWTGRRARFLAVARAPRELGLLTLSAAMIAVNWFAFIYAIQIGQTGEASFGYYAYPIAVMVLGVVVFREGLTALQWLAAAIATGGVVWIGIGYGAPPWIALIVMTSFAAYGTIRKLASTGPLVGVLWELSLTVPLLLVWLLWIGGGAFLHSMSDALLLIGGSIFTGLPLVLFVEAAKRLRFSTVGVLFYVNPTLQFVSAVILGESFGADRLIGFGIIWVAVLLYCAELLRRDRAHGAGA